MTSWSTIIRRGKMNFCDPVSQSLWEMRAEHAKSSAICFSRFHIAEVFMSASNRTRRSATAKSTARPSCLVGVFHDISRWKICWWLINYVIGHESYRIRRNNANYTAITPFKIIQGHRFWYQSKAHIRLLSSD